MIAMVSGVTASVMIIQGQFVKAFSKLILTGLYWRINSVTETRKDMSETDCTVVFSYSLIRHTLSIDTISFILVNKL